MYSSTCSTSENLSLAVNNIFKFLLLFYCLVFIHSLVPPFRTNSVYDDATIPFLSRFFPPQTLYGLPVVAAATPGSSSVVKSDSNLTVRPALLLSLFIPADRLLGHPAEGQSGSAQCMLTLPPKRFYILVRSRLFPVGSVHCDKRTCCR